MSDQIKLHAIYRRFVQRMNEAGKEHSYIVALSIRTLEESIRDICNPTIFSNINDESRSMAESVPTGQAVNATPSIPPSSVPFSRSPPPPTTGDGGPPDSPMKRKRELEATGKLVDEKDELTSKNGQKAAPKSVDRTIRPLPHRQSDHRRTEMAGCSPPIPGPSKPDVVTSSGFRLLDSFQTSLKMKMTSNSNPRTFTFGIGKDSAFGFLVQRYSEAVTPKLFQDSTENKLFTALSELNGTFLMELGHLQREDMTVDMAKLFSQYTEFRKGIVANKGTEGQKSEPEDQEMLYEQTDIQGEQMNIARVVFCVTGRVFMQSGDARVWLKMGDSQILLYEQPGTGARIMLTQTLKDEVFLNLLLSATLNLTVDEQNSKLVRIDTMESGKRIKLIIHLTNEIEAKGIVHIMRSVQ